MWGSIAAQIWGTPHLLVLALHMESRQGKQHRPKIQLKATINQATLADALLEVPLIVRLVRIAQPLE